MRQIEYNTVRFLKKIMPDPLDIDAVDELMSDMGKIYFDVMPDHLNQQGDLGFWRWLKGDNNEL